MRRSTSRKYISHNLCHRYRWGADNKYREESDIRMERSYFF
jgi:hypothetical protein